MNHDTAALIFSYLGTKEQIVLKFTNSQFAPHGVAVPTLELERKRRILALGQNPRFEIVEKLGIDGFKTNLSSRDFITPNIVAKYPNYPWDSRLLSRNNNFNYDQIAAIGPVWRKEFAKNANCSLNTLLTREFAGPDVGLPTYSFNPNYWKFEMKRVKIGYLGVFANCSLGYFKKSLQLEDPSLHNNMWRAFSGNPALTLEFARENAAHVDWRRFSKFVTGLDLRGDVEFEINGAKYRWDRPRISLNHNYRPEELINTKFYSEAGVCLNPHLTLDFVKKYDLEGLVKAFL